MITDVVKMEFALLPRIRPLIYLLLVTCTAFTIYVFSHYSQRNWLLWSALTLALITLGSTFGRRIKLMVMTGAVTAAAVFLAGCVSAYLPLIALYLALVTGAAIFFSQRHPHYFLLAFIVNVFVVLAGCLPAALAASMERAIFILGGTAIAVLYQAIFWPNFLRDEMRVVLRSAIQALAQFNEEVFSCLLHPDYTENRYLYERRVHAQKNLFMQYMEQWRSLNALRQGGLSAETLQLYSTMSRMLDLLYGSLLDIASLRWRVGDPTVLGVCTDELAAILQEMNKLFASLQAVVLRGKQTINTAALEEKIRYFEDNYQNVLQVTAPDPLVFLLFIDSLKSFCIEMQTLNVRTPAMKQGFNA